MASPDLSVPVGIVADALATLVETEPGRVPEPGADLTSSPAVGIEPAAPWAVWRKIGRELAVAWRLRIIVGRWETGPALDVALETYRLAAPPLRLAGFDVGPLEAPTVVQLAGNLPHLLAAFPITQSTR